MVTDKKSGKPVVKTIRIKRLAREIAEARRGLPVQAGRPLILLYGGGSFGHPLARKYQLSGRALSRDSLVGVGKTISAMHKLGGALANIFLAVGVPVVSLQTSSFVGERKGKLVITNYALIEDILTHGGVPLLGGDVIVADRRRTTIASADRLAAEFARHFKSRRLFFATDVNGVYEKFPPPASAKPLSVIHRNALTSFGISPKTKKNSSRDMTGAMAGKLRALLPLRNCTVTIFSGLVPNVLAKVLRGESHGTRIVL